LIDDKNAIAGIVYQQEGPGWCCKKIDLSRTYQGVRSFIRTFIFIEDKGLIIWDSVELLEENNLQWRLHSHLDAQIASEQVYLQEGDLRYECAIVGDNRVLPTIELAELDPDELDEAYHLQWEFPATYMHNIVVSCLKEKLDITFQEQGVVAITLEENTLMIDNVAASIQH